ncbi:hypothetical protein [Paenibacillus sinopodophylli]|uniref:hypothetical protein n=1 Tax=Paenibacillus sinopodophylli TaxID=1837342 RepID=UPI00110CC076|nr:hypothetical protein [Paenibacillus sinopodophylli]
MMTSNERLNKTEQEQLSAAWSRLEEQLEHTEQSPLWEQWESQAVSNHTEQSAGRPVSSEEAVKEAPDARGIDEVQAPSNVVPLGRKRAISSESDSRLRQSGAVQRWFRRNKGKTVAACAAALLAVVIAIPSTNEALAAWLNTFRMEKVIVVNEGDLQSLMNSFIGEGESLERNNRFGSFEKHSVGSYEAITAEQAAAKLGFPLAAIKLGEDQTTAISSIAAESILLHLNVNEINSAMRKLGADKLLPESVDGKAITFHTGEGVNVTYQSNGGTHSEQSVQVTYIKEPSIEVDSSVNVKDAYEAVIRFPALPEHLRTSLQRAVSLENGEIPMPLIANNDWEKVTIKAVDVYIDMRYVGQSSVNAMWLQDGIVTYAYLNGYEDEQQIKALVSELIRS